MIEASAPQSSYPRDDASNPDSKKRKYELIAQYHGLDRGLSMSDPTLASMPNRSTRGHKPCLECGESTMIDSCKVMCKFCDYPVCNACSDAQVRIIASAHSALLENYNLYTCYKCKSILEKGQLIQASRAAYEQSAGLEMLNSRIETLTNHMGTLTTILGKLEGNYAQLARTVKNKADKSEVDKLARDIEELKTSTIKQADIDDKVKQACKNEVKECNSAFIEAKLKQLRRDIQEEEARKKNLMYYRVDEPPENLTPEEEVQADSAKLESVLHDILGIRNPPKPRFPPSRIGDRKPGYKRPLKVIFRNEYDMQFCLDRFLDVKASNPELLQGIGCSRDRTKRQIERHRELRRELEDMKKRGITGYRIRGEDIVKDRSFRPKERPATGP